MKVVILCGGKGTRLREETEFRPKPMVEVGGRPIVWHIMKSYSHYGFRDFILCLGYRGNMIKQYFLDYDAMNNDFSICLGQRGQLEIHGTHEERDLRVILADTGQETMTGGRIRRIQHYLDEPTFMVTYGDGLANVDLRALLEFHLQHGKKATVTTVRPPSRFGVLRFGPSGNVLDFSEKPTEEGWVNCGFFVFNQGVLDYLTGDECVLERDPLQRLAQEGEVMAYRHDGFFYAMDTYREYLHLNELWERGEAPWKVWS